MEEINLLISVIKVSRSTKSLSNLPFWMYCLKSRFFVLILDFMISFIHTGRILIINRYIFIGYTILKNIQNSSVCCGYLCILVRLLLTIKEPFPIYTIKSFSNNFYISLFIIPYQTLVWWGIVNIKVKARVNKMMMAVRMERCMDTWVNW